MEAKRTEGFEQYMRKSKVEEWADVGLGSKRRAVEACVDFFDSLLNKEGFDYPREMVHAFLDLYYQLRFEAEKEVDMARFIEDMKKDGFDKVKFMKAPGRTAEDRRTPCKSEDEEVRTAIRKILDEMLPKSWGPEVKDKD